MKRFLAIILTAVLVLGCGILSAASAQPEIVDGKFTTTRHITVEVYDRSNDGGSKPEDNVFTKYIKEGMLRDHNVDVTFVPVPRWTEVEALNNLLASNTAPDVCVTYNYPTIFTYAQMGGVINLNDYLTQYKDMLPNLFGLLGESNIYWDQDPNDDSLWAVEALLFQNKRINTFVREDWLKKLNLAAPTTLEEFEAMLVAFKDNAELLLGADADKMVPYATSFDIGWRNDHLLCSFVPTDLSDKDVYVYGFDDRHMTFPGYKEGVRVLNKWYNEGLIWKDFSLYPAGDTYEDNMMKAGYVGAFMHNWDYPYRNGDDSIQANLKRSAGEDAAYIAIEPFKDDAGNYRKFLAAPIDRKVFLPATNKEPLASLLYLDWISDIDNRLYIQIGEKGINHEVLEDGAIKMLAVQGDYIMNSGNNIDYTITMNGVDYGDIDTTVKSVALAYAGTEAKYISAAYEITSHDARYGQNVKVGAIAAEEGMGTALTEKRDAMLNQAVVAPVDQFDAVYDSGMEDYLASGGQAIMDERKAAYERVYEK